MSNNIPPSFKVPFPIPDAPERVTIPDLVNATTALLRTGFDAFQRKPGAYEQSFRDANWWHFWLVTAASSLISSLATAFTSLLVGVQLGSRIDLLQLLVIIIISIPISFLSFYAGCYASHWWATNQFGGRARLIEHSYVLIIIWAVENIIASAITLALAFLGLTTMGLLISVAIAIYALVVMTGSLSQLYQFPQRSQVWITAGVMVLATWLTAFVFSAALL